MRDDDDRFEAESGGNAATVEGRLVSSREISSARKPYKPPRMKIELRIIFCLVLIHSLKTIGRGMRTMITSVAIFIAVIRQSQHYLLVLRLRAKTAGISDYPRD